ncbi:MAG: hypothetical protein RML93_08460 [Anaerolineales bacterium]|nr:hypothetical protein [Anaerolineales bacterium]MCS7247230.1 hypothetical protein [Anaerolineales bacterium]MDW8161041.1 hypothetical protein [Anaerolineales bacterium]MDW8447308.1 hypothetical protein [Anaerolineales bacterium]
MFLQNYLLGLILSTLYGSLFHLWRGGNLARLLFYWALSGIGFWIGHWAGNALDLSFGKVGPLQVASATLVSILCLFIGHWLSLVRSHSLDERSS